MKAFHRLHALRMENDAARYAMDEMRPRFAALKTRHETGTAPRAVSAFNLFQTPPDIAAKMAEALRLEPGARILEPSAGLGRLIDSVKSFSPSEIVAVEIAPQCCAELYRRPGLALKQRDFLTCSPDEFGLFDAVIMNPPFHLRADIAHIEHAIQFLKPGGKLVALCMNTAHRVTALKPLAKGWVDLETKAFRSEGTGISVCMMTI